MARLPTATPVAPTSTKAYPEGGVVPPDIPAAAAAVMTPASPIRRPSHCAARSDSLSTTAASPAAMSGCVLANTLAMPGGTSPPAKNMPKNPMLVAPNPATAIHVHFRKPRGIGLPNTHPAPSSDAARDHGAG